MKHRQLAIAATLVVAASAGAAQQDPERAIEVAPDGSAQFRSIQKAILSAGPGRTVRIAPGTYRERIKIQRPVVLEGAGADRVHLTASYDLHPPAPTLRIESTRNVAISGIKISQPLLQGRLQL